MRTFGMLYHPLSDGENRAFLKDVRGIGVHAEGFYNGVYHTMLSGKSAEWYSKRFIPLVVKVRL